MAKILGSIIERRRGDTAPDKVIILENGQPKDITGFSYILTLNTLKNPDPGNEILSLGGSLDPLNGVINFIWSTGNADQPIRTYWYDIQQTDPSALIKTIAHNKYVFIQDITK